MKIINTGYKFKIYNDGMQTYDNLPAQMYTADFNQDEGFYLTKYHENIEISEKVYGIHHQKVSKVLSSFEQFKRNMGVILSGDKGIGKSLFSKMLAQQAIDNGIPVIIVNYYAPGIASFLDLIHQNVMVLFDEFDKTFTKAPHCDPQTEMLTLFDGISVGKKLFVVTCNGLGGLSNFLVNRPGRFHYHFRFDYPTDKDITEYLQDKLSKEYHAEIPKVINFSKKVSLNYDCLRAIAFELQLGLPFEVAIKDLNIINLEEEEFDLTLVFEDGSKLYAFREYLDIFDNDTVIVEMDDKETRARFGHLYFTPSDNKYNFDIGGMVIEAKNLTMSWVEPYNNLCKEAYEKLKTTKIKYLLLKKAQNKKLHYTC